MRLRLYLWLNQTLMSLFIAQPIINEPIYNSTTTLLIYSHQIIFIIWHIFFMLFMTQLIIYEPIYNSTTILCWSTHIKSCLLFDIFFVIPNKAFLLGLTVLVYFYYLIVFFTVRLLPKNHSQLWNSNSFYYSTTFI